MMRLYLVVMSRIYIGLHHDRGTSVVSARTVTANAFENAYVPYFING